MPPSTTAFEPLEPRLFLSAYGASDLDTSAVMLGNVRVSVVLMESDGSIDANTEDWTADEISKIKGELIDGAAWWEDTLYEQFPLNPYPLTFTFDFTYADNPVATGYEPITRTYDESFLWTAEFIASVGFDTSGDLWHDSKAWDDAVRDNAGADWAFTVFIVDSSNDLDGQFADGYFAWAYLGGPYQVMTYDNEGWTIDRMDMVFAHETGHMFFALDEYPGSWDYYQRSGYYNTQNLNAYELNSLYEFRVPSIMAEVNKQLVAWAEHTSSPSSMAMLGWQDSDSDGIFDILDVPHGLRGVSQHIGDTFLFTGSSEVRTLPNLNPQVNGYNTVNDFTLNEIDAVQYRFDSGVAVNTLTPTHTFTEAGDYEVTMTVISADGEGVTDTLTVSVVEPSASALPFAEDFTDTNTLLTSTLGSMLIEDGVAWVYGTGATDAVATLPFGLLLPDAFSITVDATSTLGGNFLNAFVIFDYISPTNFKFAGIMAGMHQWAIGYRNANTWVTVATLKDQSVTIFDERELRVEIDGGHVALYGDGQLRASYNFAGDVTRGTVGLGTQNAVGIFDNLVVEESASAFAAPMVGDVSLATTALGTLTPVYGTWQNDGGVYRGQSTGDAVAVFGASPTDTEATISATLTAATGGAWLNAFVIFDYISATNFKFAGTFAGQDKWCIGYRNANGWKIAEYVDNEPISTDAEYAIEINLDGGNVSLSVDGVHKVSYNFGGDVTDGRIGLCTRRAIGVWSDITLTSPDAAVDMFAGYDQMVYLGDPVQFAGAASPDYTSIVWDFGDIASDDWTTAATYVSHVAQDIDIAIDTSGIAIGSHTIEIRTIYMLTGVTSVVWGDTFDVTA